MKKIILAIALACPFVGTAGQENSRPELAGLIEKLQSYQSRSGDRRIYIHTDKSAYHSGETVYFQGYILDFYDPTPRFGGDSVRVEITGNTGLSLVSRDFLIQNSVFTGSLKLPASNPGDYQLVAYSQKMTGKGIGKVFVRPLSVAPMDPLELELVRLEYLPGEPIRVEVSTSANGKPLSGSSLSFRLTDGKNTQKGSAKTGSAGTASFQVKPPKKSESGMGWVLELEAKNGKNSGSAAFPARYATNWIRMSFAPEGGRLIAGVPVRIKGFITDVFGHVLKGSVTLVSSLGERISMDAGESSIFQADCTPSAQATYSVEVSLPGGEVKTMALPSVEPSGVTLSLLSQTPQQVVFSLNTSDPAKYPEITVAAYMQGRLIYANRMVLPGKSTRLEVPVDKSGSGVAHFALFDATGNLLSERSVYIPAQAPSVQFPQENPVLAPGGKLALSYRLAEQVTGPLEVSVSLSERIEYDPDMYDFMMVLAEFPHEAYPLFLDSHRESLSEELVNHALVASSLFSWKAVCESETNLLTDSRQGLSLNTIQVAMIEPYLRQQFQSAHNLFSTTADRRLTRGRKPDNSREKDFSSYTDVLDAIRSVRVFSLINDGIVFSGARNSFYHQEGALIVIDGIKKGTDVSILKTLSPVEIADIETSTRPEDIQLYTGLNSVGIVKIRTKHGIDLTPLASVKPTEMIFSAGFVPSEESLFWKQEVSSAPEISIGISPDARPGIYRLRLEGLSNDGKILRGETSVEVR